MVKASTPLPDNPVSAFNSAGPAVTGQSTTAVGVYGVSAVWVAKGVAVPPGGFPAPDDGVLGEGKNGVHGRSSSASNSGVLGENTAGGSGVSGHSSTGPGVSGASSVAGGNALGILAGLEKVSNHLAGVYGESSDAGVYGHVTGNAGTGVLGHSGGTKGRGVVGDNTNINAQGILAAIGVRCKCRDVRPAPRSSVPAPVMTLPP